MVLKRGTCLLPKNVQLFNGTFLLTRRAGWPASLCAHSPAYLSFLAVYSVFSVRCQRKCLRIALLFQWVVQSIWAGVTILIPSAESATQSSLAE